MSSKICSSCKHFMQHYCLNNRKLFRVNCGHCTVVKPRSRRPGSKVCGQFLPGPADTDAFATKEYLSKELLQYLLSLELLPEIGELSGQKQSGSIPAHHPPAR